MNKYIYTILLFCLNCFFLQAQDYMITDPFQLSVKHASARLANARYSGSALSQAFFRNNYDLNFTLHMPYNGLTDANIHNSSFTILSPSFSWGAVTGGYSDFMAENFDEPVFSHKRIQLGYSNMLFNRVVFSLRPSWSQYTWFSDTYDDLTIDGLSLDADLIYILDGYNSLGISFHNLLSQAFSSYNGDHPGKELNCGYLHVFKNGLFDVEGGIMLLEDYQMDMNTGFYINSEAHFSNTFSIAAEYSSQFNNTFGTALSYSFNIDNWHTRLSYGFSVDDSPLPMSSFKHAFSINISMQKWRISDEQVNPQLIYRDAKGPSLGLQRISDFTVFVNDDDSDELQFIASAEDNLSGLASLIMEISPENDSSRVLYTENRSLSGSTFSDTIYFSGYTNDAQFIDNGIYHARTTAIDKAGNVSHSHFVPFRVLSQLNDSLGPDIQVEFDTSTVVLDPSEKDFVLNARITVDEKSNASVRWTINLFKSEEDSNWISQKEVSGAAEIYNHNFQWLLRKKRYETLNGKYKLKIEAYDELNNYSIRWSPVKTIIDTVTSQQQKHGQQRDIEKVETPEPTIVYIPQIVPQQNQDMQDQENLLLLEAAYSYNNRVVTLTDFKFISGRRMNIRDNQQSLSLIGFYLQDMPEARLIIEYPALLIDIPGFEKDIRDFFKNSFNIDTERIQMTKSANRRIFFKISEQAK